jgi:hypothetical protein
MDKRYRQESSHHWIALSLAAIVIAFLSTGCAMTPKPKKAVEVWDATGNRLAKATDTYKFNQIYPFSYDAVFDATYKALFRNGFQIEREDRDNGIVQGSTMRQILFPAGSNTVPFTVLVKLREISSKPRTQLDMELDTHWHISYDSFSIWALPPSEKFGPELTADIQKVLSTFE